MDTELWVDFGGSWTAAEFGFGGSSEFVRHAYVV